MRNISQEVRLKAPGSAGFYKKGSSRQIINLAKREVELMRKWQNLSDQDFEASVILLLTTLCAVAIGNSQLNAKGFVQIMDSPEPEDPKSCHQAVGVAMKRLKVSENSEMTCYHVALAARVIKKYSDGKTQ
jgi:hypothetical protein